MKTPTPLIRSAQRLTPRIESDTPIVPRAVMEGVCEEVAVYLGQPLPRRWVCELTERANTIYAHNARFRRIIRARGNKGRDYLWAFARHWLAGLIYERCPQIYSRLPSSYYSGHPLPDQPSASPLPLTTAPNTPPRARRRPRTAPQYAFAAAAHFSFP